MNVDKVVVDAITQVLAASMESHMDAPTLSAKSIIDIASHPRVREFISPQIASQVLHFAADKNGDPPEGHQGGSYHRAIYEAAFRADGHHIGLLGMAHPDLVWAVANYKFVDGGLEWLRERAQ